jgi:hypothetical protein
MSKVKENTTVNLERGDASKKYHKAELFNFPVDWLCNLKKRGLSSK